MSQPKQPASAKPRRYLDFEAFFAFYPSFRYDPRKPVLLEFERLAEQQGWDQGNPQARKAYEDAHNQLKLAAFIEFEKIYGFTALNRFLMESFFANFTEGTKVETSIKDSKEAQNLMDILFFPLAPRKSWIDEYKELSDVMQRLSELQSRSTGSRAQEPTNKPEGGSS
jgi:hypothetical protein